MLICIYGNNLLTKTLVKKLAALGHDIIVLSEENSKIDPEEIKEAEIVRGNLFDKNFLLDNQADKWDILLAVSDDESKNFFLSILVRQINHKCIIISRVINRDNLELFRKFGVNFAINIEDLFTSTIIDIILGKPRDFIEVRKGNYVLKKVIVHNEDPIVGLSIAELKEKFNIPLVFVKLKEDIYKIPPIEYKIKEGDEIIIVLPEELENEIKELVK